MKLSGIIGLLVLGASFSASAIDLVPHFFAATTEGVVVRRPYFNDGDKTYAIKLDSETKLVAYENGSLFTFEKFPDARVRLLQSPMPAQPFTEKTLPQFQAAARAMLPGDAAEVTLVETTADPLPLNNWQSYRFTFSYSVAGQRRHQSVTFLNLKPDEQIVMQTMAREENFAQIQQRGFNIIRRWHEVQPHEMGRFN